MADHCTHVQVLHSASLRPAFAVAMKLTVLTDAVKAWLVWAAFKYGQLDVSGRKRQASEQQLHQQLQAKAAQIAGKDVCISALVTVLQSECVRMDEDMGKCMDHHQAQLSAKDSIVADLQAQLAQKGSYIADLQTQLAETGGIIAQQQAQLAQKGSQTADLQAQLSQKGSHIADLQSQLSRNNELSTYDQRVLRSTLQRSKDADCQKAKEVASLQKQLKRDHANFAQQVALFTQQQSQTTVVQGQLQAYKQAFLEACKRISALMSQLQAKQERSGVSQQSTTGSDKLPESLKTQLANQSSQLATLALCPSGLAIEERQMEMEGTGTSHGGALASASPQGPQPMCSSQQDTQALSPLLHSSHAFRRLLNIPFQQSLNLLLGCYSLIHSFIPSLVRSFFHSFMHSNICHSFVHSFNQSSIHSVIHSFVHSIHQSSIHSLIHLFVHSFNHAIIHSFKQSSIHVLHPFIHSLVHSFNQTSIHACIHSLTHSFIFQFPISIQLFIGQAICSRFTTQPTSALVSLSCIMGLWQTLVNTDAILGGVMVNHLELED